MKPHYDDLLKEVLGTSGAEEFKRASLSESLAHLRRRKRWKGITQAMAFLLLAGAGVWLLLPFEKPARPKTALPALAASAPVTPSAVVTNETAVADAVPDSPIELIDDAQLLALFPGQTVALIGPPGDQRLLVFQEPPARSAHPNIRGVSN